MLQLSPVPVKEEPPKKKRKQIQNDEFEKETDDEEEDFLVSSPATSTSSVSNATVFPLLILKITTVEKSILPLLPLILRPFEIIIRDKLYLYQIKPTNYDIVFKAATSATLQSTLLVSITKKVPNSSDLLEQIPGIGFFDPVIPTPVEFLLPLSASIHWADAQRIKKDTIDILVFSLAREVITTFVL